MALCFMFYIFFSICDLFSYAHDHKLITVECNCVKIQTFYNIVLVYIYLKIVLQYDC